VLETGRAQDGGEDRKKEAEKKTHKKEGKQDDSEMSQKRQQRIQAWFKSVPHWVAEPRPSGSGMKGAFQSNPLSDGRGSAI
jgi:hypothetical protein